MKKLLTLFFIIAIALCMSLVCFASDISLDATELELYITEKIVPVVAGVLTSIVALITLLRNISKSLKGLKDTKSAFETEAEKREASFNDNARLLENKTQEIKEIVNTVPELKAQINQLESSVSALVSECYVLAEIMSLGFSANGDIVKSGKGKKMRVLVESIAGKEDKCITSEEKEDEEA